MLGLALNPPMHVQSRLQGGRSNLGDPAEWPKTGLLNWDFGSNTEFTKFFSVRTPEIY